MIKYKAVLVITGMINETSRDRLYQELGLELLVDDHKSSLLHNITQGLLVSSLETYHKAVCERVHLTR